MDRPATPEKQGLYDPQNEHDACGVGLVANINGQKSHKIIKQGLEVLAGAAASTPVLIQAMNQARSQAKTSVFFMSVRCVVGKPILI